tara:strand:- start:879 stop:2315 length:1437 start_codon:yes stop_codon:yes gene_type:complete
MSTTVAIRSSEIAAMVDASTKGRALMGRTKTMRAAGQTYLPKNDAESQTDYDTRLGQSWLFNGYRKAVLDMTGRVFSKPIEISDGPDQVIEWADNIDMAGRDLSVFLREVFKDGFQSGVSYIMVDAPMIEGTATRKQAADRGLRPFMSHLRVEDILGWKTKTYGNVLALSQLRIMESVTVQDPSDEFKQTEVPQVRVMDRLDAGGVLVRLYQKNDKGEWMLAVDGEYTTSAPEITVVPFYAERTGFMTGEPVLEDLADVNIAHWVSQSDQRNILHFFRVPILHITGRQDDSPMVIAAGTAISSTDPAAKLEWVKGDDKSINAGRQDLKDLETQMQVLGLQLIADKVHSATGAAIDAVKETSQLSMMADSLKDTAEQALQWMALYGGLGEVSITVGVNKEFGLTMLTPEMVKTMQADVAAGILSRETYIEELKARGVLRSDLDTQEELDRIDAQEPSLTGEPLDLGGSGVDRAVAALNG